MKVETKLTDRDLKLIKYVISILVVFILFWVGIRPLWETHQQLADELPPSRTARSRQATRAWRRGSSTTRPKSAQSWPQVRSRDSAPRTMRRASPT